MTAGYVWTSELQLLFTMPKSAHPLSSQQRHIRLCELLSLMHDCHSSGWWLYDPYENALSRKTLSAAVAAIHMPT